MSINKTRLAGYRLAAVPIEDVSEQLRTAYDALTQRSSTPSSAPAPAFLGGTFKVPGTGGVQVDLSARKSDRAVPFVGDEDVVFGNAEQLQPMLDPSSPGEYNLVWNVLGDSGGLSRQQQVRVAREAARQWPEIIKQIPDGAIVSNSPVGALSGDYERADLYTRYGFGPVQEDGQQFGVVRGGRIEPLSPFISDKGHAQHLAERLAATGDTSLQDAIAAELIRRKETGIEDQLYAAQQSRMQYDNYDYDYDDYDYYDERPPLTRADLKQGIQYSIAPESNEYSGNFGNVTSIPEIQARRGYEQEVSYAPEGSYQPTPADIEAFRAFQLEQLNTPSRAREVVDFINSVSPRPAPQPVTLESLAASRQNSDPFGVLFSDRSAITSGPDSERRQLSINRLRDRLGQYSEGYDSDPSVLRDQLKRDLITRRTNPDGLGVVAQELYSPQDLENFRTLQALQSQAFPVSSPLRVPPPTLNPDGTVQSRRPTPEDALINASSHLSSFNPHDELINGTTVEWRRQLTPEQQAAVDRLPDAINGPVTAQRNINHLDQWLQSGTTSSQMMRDLYGGNSVEQMLQSANINPNATPNLLRDMRTLETGLTQPGRVSADDVAQSIYNLRQLQAGQQQTLDNLRGVIATSTYGPATQVRRGPDTRPPAPVDDAPSGLESLFGRRPSRRARTGGRGDYANAPADMSMSEFLEWERQNDNISNYSLTPEQRYEQRPGTQSSRSNELQVPIESESAPASTPRRRPASSTPSVRIPSGNTPGLSDLLDAGALRSSVTPTATSALALERGRRSAPTGRRRGSQVRVDETPTQLSIPLF